MNCTQRTDEALARRAFIAPAGGQPSGDEYTIATVGDFLAVPADRQADCLAEFADWLGAARGIRDLAAAVGEDPAAQIGPFEWTDDGERRGTVIVSPPAAKHCHECGRLVTKDRWRHAPGERPLCPEHQGEG